MISTADVPRGIGSAAALALALLLAWGSAHAQMVVGPQSLPRPGEEPEALPGGVGPVVREGPAPGLAVNIDTGTTAGVYHAAGAAVCRLLAQSPQGEGVACTALYSAGSAQNIPDLEQGKVNFAIVQSDVQHFAYRGEQVFDDLGPMPELRHVVTLQPEALTIVAAPGSGIVGAADIYGKRVNLGQLGSGTFVIREMLATVDPRIETIAAVPDLKTALSADALCADRIDAFAFVAGNPNPLVQQATRLCRARLVPVIGEVPDRLLATYPFYSRVTIPAGLYPNNPQPTPTVGVHATLVTRADVPADLVHRVTEALYEGLPEFRRLHLAFKDFDRQSLAAACNAAPLHEGAARYLADAGIRPGPCPR